MEMKATSNPKKVMKNELPMTYKNMKVSKETYHVPSSAKK